MAKNISATFDLCTYTENQKTGTKMLSTRYSLWHYNKEFKSKDEARTFAKGMASGLSFKFSKAAIRVSFNDGTQEEIFNEE